MQFEFSNINTLYTQPNIIASIMKENKSAAKSNISSVYDAPELNLDAAVLSISPKGTARINAMLSKSIQLRASSSDPTLTASDRLDVSNELSKIRNEIRDIRNETSVSNQSVTAVSNIKTDSESTSVNEVELNEAEAEKMIKTSMEKILKQANDSIQIQNLNRERVLQLL